MVVVPRPLRPESLLVCCVVAVRPVVAARNLHHRLAAGILDVDGGGQPLGDTGEIEDEEEGVVVGFESEA